MTPRALLTIGIGQCVNWGVLYYAFAVLVLPLEADLGAPRWVVTGAFSLALLVSACVGPLVGSRIDAGHGSRVMRIGGVTATALLVLWAAAPSVAMLYVVWACLGLSMATTLYEPAFAVVAHAVPEPRARLRALAMITVCGGLASTVFLPLTGALLTARGWRVTVLVLALLVALSTWIVDRAVSRPVQRPLEASERPAVAPIATAAAGHRLVVLVGVFAFGSFAGAAIVAHLVPVMVERGVSATTAVLLGGLFGLMQLPGRAMVLHAGFAAAPWTLLAVSLGMQAAGLAMWGLGSGAATIGVGLAVFAMGAGLATLVRPFLIQELYGATHFGYLSGRLSRAQQLARAAGPVFFAVSSAAVTYRAMLLALAATFALLTVASLRRNRLDMVTT